jgi:hypothetical protein
MSAPDIRIIRTTCACPPPVAVHECTRDTFVCAICGTPCVTASTRAAWEPDMSRTCRSCGCKSLDATGHCDRCGWSRGTQ